MILTMNKTRISYVALIFDPLPQIMKSGVQIAINVCQYVNNMQMRHYSVDISVNLRSKDDKRYTIFHSISGT